MNAPVRITQSGELVLRVLNGRLKGAEHRLHNGKFIRVGHSFDHDVVLRGHDTAGLSVELQLLDGMASVRVKAGRIMLLGRPLEPGDEAHLPFFVPVWLGEFALAVGDAREARWNDADALMASMQTQGDDEETEVAVAQPASPLERLVTRLYPLRDWVDVKADGRKLALTGGAALLLIAAAGPAWFWLQDQFEGPQQIQSTLQAVGYQGLSVSRDDDQSPVRIHGTLRSDADLARLRSFVAARFGEAVLDVETTESHASAATEILTAQGIDAQARASGVGTILIDGEYLPTDRQTGIRQLLKADLPAIRTVHFHANDAKGQNGLQYFFSSGDYGIATVVDGDPSYILTADGTRWFSGATVPTGHRILAIAGGKISFEREGRVDELIL